MPTISEFFGIRIEIRFLDHNPPHFHAKYQNDKISVEIKDGKVKGENVGTCPAACVGVA